MRRFYFSQIPSINETFFVPKDQVSHLSRVLRVNTGDILEASNGSGQIFELSIIHIDKENIQLKVLSSKFGSEKALHSVAFIGELKNDAMDNTISLLAEHGIQKIIPFFAKRSIPKYDLKQLTKKQERRQKIANEAIKKVGGLYPCQVMESISFKDIEHSLANISQKIIFWEEECAPSQNLNNINYNKDHAFFIGPEGGFSQKEIDQLLFWKCQSYSLGTRILRAPQAAAAAVAIIRYLTENQ